MDALQTMLDEKKRNIVDEATAGLRRAHLRHYESAGVDNTRQRLESLYDLTRESVRRRKLTAMIQHADGIARERFEAGYDLLEIQTAFNILEEVIWKRVLNELRPEEFASALGLVSTVLGAGKDALARTYVSLACGTRAASLNLEALFEGAID